MSDVNTVLLSTAAYASVKNENCKLRLLVDNLLTNATLSEDASSLEFDPEYVAKAVEFVFADEYKKRLSYLRGRATKQALKESAEASIEDNKEEVVE